MKKILALITAASMLLCAVPQYAHPDERGGRGGAGLEHRNRHAGTSGFTSDRGRDSDRRAGDASGKDLDDDARRDAAWTNTRVPTKTTTATTTLPVRPGF